jgi:hypothetical protein
MPIPAGKTLGSDKMFHVEQNKKKRTPTHAGPLDLLTRYLQLNLLSYRANSLTQTPNKIKKKSL